MFIMRGLYRIIISITLLVTSLLPSVAQDGAPEVTPVSGLQRVYKGKYHFVDEATGDTLCMIVMNPIVCKIYNSAGSSDYENGFQADVAANENSDLARFLPFGNPDELMLNTALGLIGGTSATTSTASGLRTTVLHNSVKRREAQSVHLK